MNTLAGLFGMFEMEKAAEKILEIQHGNPDQTFSFLPYFNTDYLAIGFSELLFHGWLEKPNKSYPYNGSFVPTKEFFTRVNGKG